MTIKVKNISLLAMLTFMGLVILTNSLTRQLLEITAFLKLAQS